MGAVSDEHGARSHRDISQTEKRYSGKHIYVNQLDTQCFMIEFIHNTWFTSSMLRIRNKQLVNAPEDAPLRSETCRATKCHE